MYVKNSNLVILFKVVQHPWLFVWRHWDQGCQLVIYIFILIILSTYEIHNLNAKGSLKLII